MLAEPKRVADDEGPTTVRLARVLLRTSSARFVEMHALFAAHLQVVVFHLAQQGLVDRELHGFCSMPKGSPRARPFDEAAWVAWGGAIRGKAAQERHDEKRTGRTP